MSLKKQDEQIRELYREHAAELLKILDRPRSSYADWQESRREPTPARHRQAPRRR